MWTRRRHRVMDIDCETENIIKANEEQPSDDIIQLFPWSPGNVYVKCVNVSTAVAAVNALHGRWFAGFPKVSYKFHSISI